MNKDIRIVKRELRDAIKKKRRAMTEEYKRQCDLKIFEKLKNLWAFRSCDTVFAYVSTQIEVDTAEIINYCLQTGRKVAVPRCTEKSGEMLFYYIDSLEQLKPGHFGVREPEADESRLAGTENGLCLVPALSFDRQGYRLGYGKGYYDRFLSSFGGDVVGLCYEDCINETLPHGRFDRTIRAVVTDKRILISG
ncbi:MAG: 5-formyltetrahydrofolate cyclo-ligase [Clostridia bacterium]|nr:5-formyltetrahydrofolate cyclo-ligase [Clostridia bacterium]